MLVVFKNDWFAGLGNGRYRKTNTPQEVPDELLDRLPSTAKVVAMTVTPKVVVEEVASFKDFDSGRKEAKEYGQLIKDAQRAGDQYNLVSEAAYKLIDEHNLDIDKIIGTGKDGRVTKFDVEDYLSQP